MKLTNVEPELKLVYKTVDGVNLPMWVYYPAGGLKEKNKAILTIHGGGWHDGITSNKDWNGSWMSAHAKYYANKGYVGIAISYRSIDISDKVFVGDLIKDCEDAVRYIRDNLDFVDMETLVVMGDSAGGHLATMLGISRDSEIRPCGVVACNPVLDCTREKWSYGFKEAKDAVDASPIKQEPKECSKFLILHGTKDSLVEIEDSIDFNEKLKKLGHQSEFIEIPGAEHAFVLFGYTAAEEDVYKVLKIIDEKLDTINRI